MKFGSKRAIFGVIWFFLGVWTFLGISYPTHPHLGDLSQMWVGGVADSQTRSKPLKTTPNHPKNRPFLPEFHLLFSQISQKPLGGWVNRFGTLGDIPKKSFFWAGFPILHCGKVVLCHLGRLRSSWFFLWNLVAEHDKCWACFHLYTV